jgi:hypothetical protein
LHYFLGLCFVERRSAFDQGDGAGEHSAISRENAGDVIVRAQALAPPRSGLAVRNVIVLGIHVDRQRTQVRNQT